MPYSSLYFKSKWSFPSSLSEQPAMEIRGKMAAKNLTTIFLNPIALPVFQTTIESTRQEHGNPILWFCTSVPAVLPPTHFRGDFAFKWYDCRTIVMKNKLSCQSFAQRKPDLKMKLLLVWRFEERGERGSRKEEDSLYKKTYLLYFLRSKLARTYSCSSLVTTSYADMQVCLSTNFSASLQAGSCKGTVYFWWVTMLVPDPWWGQEAMSWPEFSEQRPRKGPPPKMKIQRRGEGGGGTEVRFDQT